MPGQQENSERQNSKPGNQQTEKNEQQSVSGTGNQGGEQSIPLSTKGQQLDEQLDEQIGQFEQQLQSKSNSEIKQISNQLDIIEREMLLEKVDNQLKTIKETIIKPGDIASTAAAGAAAASAVQTQPPNQNTTGEP